tara:strand:+ start:260 stop:613 length:354 start_codon:yes stop_codon:yes gene_type:complete
MLLLSPKKSALLNSCVLIIIGFISFNYTKSTTALIPVFLGFGIFLCYVFYEKNNKIFAHICIALMFLAFLGLFMPLMKSIDRLDTYATLRISLMQLVTLHSIVCFISNFIESRRNKN